MQKNVLIENHEKITVSSSQDEFCRASEAHLFTDHSCWSDFSFCGAHISSMCVNKPSCDALVMFGK